MIASQSLASSHWTELFVTCVTPSSPLRSTYPYRTLCAVCVGKQAHAGA